MTNFYRNGSECVCVETGMPEQAVQIGTGYTPRQALASLEATPMQSVGRDNGEAAALRWAASAWLDGVDPENLIAIEVTDADMDDRMHAWDAETVWSVETWGADHWTVRQGGLPREVALTEARKLARRGERVSIVEYAQAEGSSAISRSEVEG